jgi:hypothetical protein
MFGDYAFYNANPILQWLWKHGCEEPVGPLDPVVKQFGPQPEPWVSGPSPEPWRVAVPQLVQAVQARELAAKLEGHAREELVKSSGAAVDSILDDWCGTPPRRWPWPWPGPPPWVWEIASQLTLIANTVESGTLREGLLEVAGRAIQRSSGPQ